MTNNDLFHFIATVLAWPVAVITGFMVGLALVENLITAFVFPLRDKGDF